MNFALLINRRFNRGMKSVSEGSTNNGEREEAGKRISRRHGFQMATARF